MHQGEAGRPFDRRVARSRRAIMGAFEQLLFERPFEKITVSAIAQRADVDRKTFYQHFGTIDGLLSALAERCVQQIVEAMDEEPDGAEAPYASGGSPRSDDGPREITAFFTAVNRVLSVNFEVNRRLVECMSTESIVERIREPLLDKLCDRHGSVMELDGRELGHAADFMLGGLVSVYRTWVLKEDREPIECVSHRMEILLAGSLRALLEEAEARSGTAGGV